MDIDLSDLFRVAYYGVFVTCAVTDIWFMRIPNMLVLLLLALFVAAALAFGGQVQWFHHVIPAAIAFAIGAALFYFGKFGGGDVKLLSVAVLWVGLAGLSQFLVVLGIAGVVLLLVFQRMRQPALFGLMRLQEVSGLQFRMPKALDTASHLPYGVAIAVAALVTSRNLSLIH
jgi:prepilin peptidase CpaA